MRIVAVTPSAVPFVRGGFERLWEGVVDHINSDTEHSAELIAVPSPEATLHDVVASYRHFSELRFDEFDLVLTGKYPAWMIDHPRQVIYLAHKLRGLYDTYPSSWPTTCTDPAAEAFRRQVTTAMTRADLAAVFDGYDELVAHIGADHAEFGHPSPLGRAVVHTLDRIGMARGAVSRYLAISSTVADRPDYFPPGVTAEVALPPTTVPTRTRRRGEHFFTASRLDAPKRLHLLVEAMGHVRTDARLLIAGDGPERGRLEALADDVDRVELLGRVSDDELAELYGTSIAVPFIPDAEDYGLIALEAMEGGTPVITCTDSGGPTELVEDGATGLVVEPTVEALAEAIDTLASSPDLADDMGAAAALSVADITWSAVLEALLADDASGAQASTHDDSQVDVVHRACSVRRRRVSSPAERRPSILVLNTFTAHNPKGGGQLRAFNLYRSLSTRFDVTLLSLDEAGRPAWERSDTSCFTETSVPRTLSHGRYEADRAAAVGIPVSDIFGGIAVERTPRYLHLLERHLPETDIVVLAHPYMYPALTLVDEPSPLVVYDAYNVESVLKDSMLPSHPAADELRRLVVELESATLELADLVSVCSKEDAAIFEHHHRRVPPIHVAPNGTDLSRLDPIIGSDRVARRRRWLQAMGRDGDETRLALFLGSWHEPNIEAARFIHGIAEEMESVLFLMVGSHCDALRGENVPDNVLQLGLVSDATKRVLLGAADVGVNPMAAGSGTNLKLVEYLAAGLPTVSTPIGARGLPETDPPLCTIVGLDEFATAVRSLLTTDPASDGSVADALRARALVEDAYDWTSIGESLATRMLELL